MNEWKEVKLGDVCSYVSDRTPNQRLNLSNYISTENMLPGKCGITTPSGLPTTSVIEYISGDTLVSNIRPYFKKIWYADKSGGCSTDVLNFRSDSLYNSKFLYYVLSNDKFFEYSMSTSKGTKMPRGDKKSLMNYTVPLPPLHEQKAIADTLSCLDDKIELNNKINKNLEAQAQAIFKSWFVDFDPFQYGEFVDSEIGRIPKGWRVGTLGEVADIASGKRPLIKVSTPDFIHNVPIIGASSIMGYTNQILYNQKILVTGRVGTHGIIQRCYLPCWASDNTLVIKSNFFEFVYQILSGIDFKSMNRGSTQPLITQTDLKNVSVLVPSDSILDNFEIIATSLMNITQQNQQQTQTLTTLRDTLLPKLMSGEIRVPVEVE